MASYRIEWKRSAVKDLKGLPQRVISSIVEAVVGLAADPYPPGVKKLVGSEHTYRVREGNYRIIYTVTKENLVIGIIKIGHRKDVYDR